MDLNYSKKWLNFIHQKFTLVYQSFTNVKFNIQLTLQFFN